MAAQDPVSVPRWLLLGGGLSLGASLLALAFLAGRASTEPATQPATQPPATPTVAGMAAPDPAAPPTAAAQLDPVAPAATAVTAGSATPPSSAAVAAAPATQPRKGAGSAAVVGYLDALETALETPNAGNDPDELAQAVVADALSGRTQAIDQLLSATEGARARARALTPPAPAATLHRDTLTLLDQTLRVYGSLRASIASGDIAGISGLQGDANKLERAARDVEAETRRLRDAHGG
jgi:hypothetical protein